MPHVPPTGPESLPNTQRVRAHCPELLEGLNTYYEKIWLSDRVDAGVKELVRMHCATINACRY